VDTDLALADASAGGDDVVILGFDGAETAVSWAQLAAAASRLGGLLRAEGIGDDAVLVVAGETSYETLLTVFAAWECGAAVSVVPTGARRDPASVASEIERRAGLLGARGVVAPSQVVERLAADRSAGVVVLDHRAVLAAAESSTPGSPGGAGIGSQWLAIGVRQRYHGDRVAVFQATSGTTGDHRIVPVTWRMLRGNVTAIARRLELGRHESVVSWMPLYHDMGLIAFVVMPVMVGARLTLIPPEVYAAAPSAFPAMIDRRRGTLGGTTSSGLALLERGLRRGGPFDLSSLRCLLCGAEMIDVELCERAVAAGAAFGLREDVFSFAYGMAEATLGISVHPPATAAAGEDTASCEPGGGSDAGWLRPGGRGFARTGRPIDGIEVRIVDVEARLLQPEGGVGEIEVRGSSVMSAYVGFTAAESGVGESGWLRTGDLGYLSDGEVVIVGRLKDVLVLGGRNVVPEDVERIVGALDGVRPGRVAAVSVMGRAGEALAIVAERVDGAGAAAADERDVRVAVTRELGVAPASVTFVPPGTVLKTTSGKLRRSACRQLVGRVAPSAATT
jgi:fatty-acyl-CoA synthase